jgi:site-specific recombinase XerD
MIKFKAVILTKEKCQNDEINVKVRVTHNRIVRFVATDYYVIEKYFDQKSQKILTGGGYSADEADKANGKIQMLIGDMVRKTDKLPNLRFMDMRSLMKILRDKRPDYDLYSVLEDRMSKFKNAGNINYYNTILRTKRAVEIFTGARLVPFTSIDYGWLIRFQSSNTIGIHMRDIRTAFNQAITLGIAELSSYPFRKYHIPKEKTRKRNLTAEEMQKIVHLKTDNKNIEWSRSMFMLSFYLLGINMRDLMFLTQENIEGDRLYYKRSKGKKDYSIKIFPEAKAIMDQYAGKQYILDTMERYSDYLTATHLINEKLKKIAEACKINKNITVYWARHTWATIAISKKIGASRDIVRYGLGHAIGSLVSDIYIEYDLSQVDAVNRKVIKLVQQKATQPRGE